MQRRLVRNIVANSKVIARSQVCGSMMMKNMNTIKKQQGHQYVSFNTKSMIQLGQQQLLRAYTTEAPDGVEIVELPSVSPTMTEGVIVEWFVAEGDKVEPGDILCSIKSDKAVVEFEYQEEGYVAKILEEASDNPVPVRKPIALIVEEEGDIEAAKGFTPSYEEEGQEEVKEEEVVEEQKAPEPAKEEAKTETKTASSSDDRIRASPFARKLAIEKGIDIGAVVGTGPNGRVVAADVEEYTPSARKAMPDVIASADYEDTPTSMMRATIAKRLLESKTQVPHYYLTVEVEMDALMEARALINKRGNGEYKLSVNDFIIKAAALAMREVPEVNSSWQGDVIRQYKNVDVSVAVQTDNGLITPIVPKAEGTGLVGISNKVKELATKARENTLQPHEYQGGTFTVSNLGMFGIKEFSAIINPPQACILAVGTASKKITQNAEGDYESVAVMNATLSCDHRVVDGAVGARWLKAFKANMEDPLRLIL